MLLLEKKWALCYNFRLMGKESGSQAIGVLRQNLILDGVKGNIQELDLLQSQRKRREAMINTGIATYIGRNDESLLAKSERVSLKAIAKRNSRFLGHFWNNISQEKKKKSGITKKDFLSGDFVKIENSVDGKIKNQKRYIKIIKRLLREADDEKLKRKMRRLPGYILRHYAYNPLVEGESPPFSIFGSVLKEINGKRKSRRSTVNRIAECGIPIVRARMTFSDRETLCYLVVLARDNKRIARSIRKMAA